MEHQLSPSPRSKQPVRAAICLLGISVGFLLLSAAFGEDSTIGRGAVVFAVFNGLFGVALLRSHLFLRDPKNRQPPSNHGQ